MRDIKTVTKFVGHGDRLFDSFDEAVCSHINEAGPVRDWRGLRDFLNAIPDDTAPAEPDNDGWIPWPGGECPVGPNVLVDIRFRNGEEFFGQRAGEGWSWGGGDGDLIIIAYRLHKPEAQQ